MNDRTVIDFVEDMISSGRSLKHIIAVAQNSKWKDDIELIREIHKITRKRLKSNLTKRKKQIKKK